MKRSAKASKPLKPFPITAQRFAAACAGCFLSIEQTAKSLRVSERTLRNLETVVLRIHILWKLLLTAIFALESAGSSRNSFAFQARIKLLFLTKPVRFTALSAYFFHVLVNYSAR